MGLMHILLMLSLISFQDKRIEFHVYDNSTKTPIEDVEAVSYEYSTFSNLDGRIVFFYNKIEKITLNHLNYTSITIPISQIKDSVFLESTQFKTDLLVVADRIRLVQAGVSEVKTERVALPERTINALPQVNTAIKSMSQVTVTEDINGQNVVNVLGSNDNEVRYYLNGLNLYSYAEQRNYSNLVLTQLLKEINLDLGSHDDYLAKINLQIDQFLKPSFIINLGNNERSLKKNFIITENKFISVSGINYSTKYTENKIKDEFDTYDYNYSTDQYNINDFIYYKNDDFHLQNSILYEYKNNQYHPSITLKDRSFSNGLNLSYDQWELNVEFFGKYTQYNNLTSSEYKDVRKSQSLQSRIGIQNTIGDSIRGYHIELELLNMNEDLYSRLNQDIIDAKEHDLLTSININKKFVPKELVDKELKTVLEFGVSGSRYREEFFVKSASVKTALAFEVGKNEVDFYSDINFGKMPLLNVNRMYLSAQNDTITPYLENTNMTFGTTITFPRAKLDLSYSQRTYKSYLSKVYGVIFNDFKIYTENDINTFNVKLDLNINRYLNGNASAMFTNADDFLQFTNKPEFLLTTNLMYTNGDYQVQLSLKQEKGKYLTYLINDILYQREIEETKDISVFFTIEHFLMNDLSMNFSITNLLGEKIYTLNGFYSEKRNYLWTTRYDF
jgi:hypothetical protein